MIFESDFDINKNSPLEEINFSKEKPENFNYVENFTEINKQFLESLFKNHKLFLAKREIYGKINNKKFSETAGVSLEEFLVYFFGDNNLEKANEKKWEHNKIDLFFNKIGIQLTVARSTTIKNNELNIIRNKIDSGENFYEKNKKKNGVLIPILNEEVPENIVLLSFKSPIIQNLVNNNIDFFVNLKNLSDDDFIELYNQFKIIKDSFYQIIEEIEKIEKNREVETGKIKYKQIIEDINDPQKSYKKNIKKTNLLLESEKFKINYKFIESEDKISFEVFNKKGKLIYNFCYYLCNKKIVNNSSDIEDAKMRVKNKNKFNNLTLEQKKSNRLQLTKKIENTIKKIDEIKNKIKKIKYNINPIKNNFLKDFFVEKEIENLENYNNLRDFFENLDRKKLKFHFNNLRKNNEKIIEKQKEITWLSDFIENTEKILNGEEINLEKIGVGNIFEKEVLLQDPIIKNYNLIEKSEELKNIFLKIKKSLENSSYIENKEKFYLKIQKIFFLNHPTSNSGINFLNGFIKKLENTIKKLDQNGQIGFYRTRKKLKNKSKKEILGDNRDNKQKKEIENLKELLENLKNFKEKSLKLKKNIKSIDLENIFYTKLTNKNIIFSKKYLLNIIISNIFNGESLKITNFNTNKILKKLKKFDSSLNEDFIKFIQIYNDFGDSLNEVKKENFIKEYILDGLKKLKEKQNEIINKGNFIGEEKNELDEYFNKVDEIKILLTNFFSKEIIDENEFKIKKFLKLFLENNKNFRNSFINLIKDIGVENIKDFYEIGNKIEFSNNLIEKINNFSGFNINVEELHTKEDFENTKKLLDYTLEDFKSSLEKIKENLNYLK